MAWRTPIDQETRAKLLVEYQDGWSVNELSIIYRVSERTVYRIIHDSNQKKRPPRKTRLMPCGTNAGYARHRRNGEYPCTECLEAHAADVMRAKKKTKQSLWSQDLLQPCGTRAAYRRHLKRRQVPCAPCKEAQRLHNKRRYSKVKERKNE